MFFCPACGVEIDVKLGQVAGHDLIVHEDSGYELSVDVRCLVKEQLFIVTKEEF